MKTLIIDDIVTPDRLAVEISRYKVQWELHRQNKREEWKEIQQYVFATDTTQTSNAKLPWSNKTTTPKLCQIRDNLFANYMSSMFPKRKWFEWQGESLNDEEQSKKRAIESYMQWVTSRNEFFNSMSDLVLDYIDFGNTFATVEWVDRSYISQDPKDRNAIKRGFAGPVIRRISPLDIVFDPTAPSFEESPKIISSFVTLGDAKEILERDAKTQEEMEDAEKIYEYLLEVRETVGTHVGNVEYRDNIYSMTGFDSYQSYLGSNYVEVLTFYGDIYDKETKQFLRNQIIKVVDRTKIISKRTNPSGFGAPQIYHVGWRRRPDNLWAMGPLDNLVGMQYRIDHLENMKADVFDILAYPVFKIKGHVEDFTWGPFERIYVGDDGDVQLISPPAEVLNADNQIMILERKMEEMAGAPREALGFRTPGEKTKYEVQRLENAAARVFLNKISQFEMMMVENLLNAMLELARRNITEVTTIRVMNDETRSAVFRTLTPDDVSGNGRLKPYAARHFAEVSQRVQDLSTFFQSEIGRDPSVRVHFSALQLARLMEEMLEMEEYKVVVPYIRISEQAEAELMQATAMEDLQNTIGTPAGIAPGDHDPELEQLALSGGMGGTPQGPGPTPGIPGSFGQ